MCKETPAIDDCEETSSGGADDDQSKRERLLAYLRERAANTDGDLYVKSKFVAEDVGLSAREIGARMGELEAMDVGIAVERWAYTGGTTWRVRLTDQ